MDKRWRLLEAPFDMIRSLQEQLKIHPAICSLLINRGIRTFDQAREYFRPSALHLHSPWLMKDMDKAVDRIERAREDGEKILVLGDYDVDGTTAVACLFQFLSRFFPLEDLGFYIPHRYREGYGISVQSIEFAAKNGFTLIISMDCGIKSVGPIRYARERGIEFIVCDHHLPDHELPSAHAILNPKQIGCAYPYKELCGCGVGFKLITALAERWGIAPDEYDCYLDLVATAIAADIVPMTGENRTLACLGLQRVNAAPCPGVQALLDLSGLKTRPLQIRDLVFVIAPRVNAAGRMDEGSKAVQLFLEKDYHLALQIAASLHHDNADRKETDTQITAEAISMIKGDEVLLAKKSTVLFQPHWHKGVVGIVASRLIEQFYRPTIVLTKSGDLVAGSARSVAGFNLYEAIHECREYLLGYGGHFAAAGMTLSPENVSPFAEKFEQVVQRQICEEQLRPEIVIDTELGFRAIDTRFLNILRQMEPFGPENACPLFITRNVFDTGWSKLVKDHHIKFSLVQDQVAMEGIGFNLAPKFELLKEGRPIDIVYSIEENEWNGQRRLQLMVKDFRTATTQS